MKWASILFFFVMVSSVQGTVIDEIFSKSFVQNSGTPTEEIYHFDGINGPATITVTNGGPEGISSSVLFLNDIVVFDAANFSQQVESIQILAPINLGDNVLKVILEGKPGERLHVSITQEAEKIETLNAALGGLVSVDDSESAIAGTTIEIPPEAIPDNVDNVKIKITATKPPEAFPEGLYQTGNTVNIKSSIESFNETHPLRITLPYDDQNNDGAIDGATIHEGRVGVVYLDRTTMKWRSVAVVDRNQDLNLVTIETTYLFNSTAFALIYNPPKKSPQMAPNGFQIIKVTKSQSE